MRKITNIAQREEMYIISFDDGTKEGYVPTPFEMWLIEQILEIKQKVGA